MSRLVDFKIDAINDNEMHPRLWHWSALRNSTYGTSDEIVVRIAAAIVFVMLEPSMITNILSNCCVMKVIIGDSVPGFSLRYTREQATNAPMNVRHASCIGIGVVGCRISSNL